MKLSSIKEIVRQMYTILNKKQKKGAIVVIILTLIGSIFEMLGVTAIIPFMTAILNADLIMKNENMQVIIKELHIQDSTSLIVWLSIFMMFIYIVKNTYLTISSYIKFKYQSLVQKELSVYMLESYEYRPYTFFLDTNSGDIYRGITNDIAGVYAVLDSIFKTFAETTTALAICVTIFVMDWTMAISIMLFAGISMYLIFLFFSKNIKKLGLIQRDMTALMYKDAAHAVNGIKDIKVMRRENSFVQKFSETVGKQMLANQKYNFAGSCPERLIETVCIIGIITIVTIKIVLGVDVSTFIPNLAALAVAAFRILPSVSRISGYINNIIYFRPSLQCTYENVLEAEKNKVQREEKNNADNISKIIPFENEIHINNISWHYPKQEKNVLNNLSITIQKGTSIGIIGPSGAGKTTLGDLILGLYKPQEGDIQVDGRSIYSNLDMWSTFVGYVSQSVYLIDDTIRNNVLFGIEESDGGEEKIWNALEQAQLSDFVKNLPEQLDTVVGERGIKFSGGQRQRIAIARALYYNPEVLILDEATSALDNETEKAVIESIEYLKQYKTIIMIAHRLSTIEKCDHIYEVKDGVASEILKDELYKRERER